MNTLEQYVAFVTAYEHSRRTDEWASVSRLMAEDVVFVLPVQLFGGATYEDRAGFLLHHKTREALFNRCFAHADIGSLGIPAVSRDQVSHRVYAGWRAEGLPDLLLEFELRVAFEDGLVVRVEEGWEPKMIARLHEYVAEHEGKLPSRLDVLDLSPTEELGLLRRGMQLGERRVTSRNSIDGWDGPRSAAEPAWVECSATWSAAGIPSLRLKYALEWSFDPGGEIDAKLHWEAPMLERLRAHLDAHGMAIRQRAGGRER